MRRKGRGCCSSWCATSRTPDPASSSTPVTAEGRLEGAAAFGAASLAFLRFTKGPWGAAILLGVSLLFWIVAPAVAAIERLRRADV